MRRAAVALTSLALMVGTLTLSPTWANAVAAGGATTVDSDQPRLASDEAGLTNTDELVVGWSTSEGQSLVQGGRLPATLSVMNISETDRQARITIDLPRGISVREKSSGWRCRALRDDAGRRAVCRGPRLANGGVSVMNVSVAASQTAPVGTAVATARDGDSTSDLVVHVLDPGDPVASGQVWVKTGMRWKPWTDGSVRELIVGDVDQWRFVVNNIGSMPLGKGRSITMRQRFAADVEVEVLGKRAQDCDFTGQLLTCVIKARADVEPIAMIGSVTVALAPTVVGSTIVDGPTVAYVGKARRAATRQSVLARAVNPDIDVLLDTSLEHGLVRGSSDTLRMNVRRTGNEKIVGLFVRGEFPKGVSLSGPVETRTWSCTPLSTSVECELLREVPANGASAPIRLPLEVASSAPLGVTSIEWEFGFGIGAPKIDLGQASTSVTIAPPLDVDLQVPSTITSATDGADAAATFAAHVKTSDGRAHPVVWSQECVDESAAGPRCEGMSGERVTVVSPNNTKTTVLFPDTDDARNYRFTATIAPGKPWQVTRSFTTTVVTSEGTVALLGDGVPQLVRPPGYPPPPGGWLSNIRPPMELPTLGAAEDSVGLPDSISLGSGVTLKDLRATSGSGVAPITADGRLEFTAGASSASAKVSVSYTDAQNWTARVVSGSTGEWDVLAGFSLDISGLSGTVANQSGTLAWGLQWGTSSPWQVTKALSVTAAAASVSDACPEQVTELVHCVQGDLIIVLQGKAALDGGELGSITADIEAVIRPGDETGFAIAGGVDAGVTITPGISFNTNPTLFAYRALSPTSLSPPLQDETADEPTVTLVGDMAIEPFGTFAHMQAMKNEQGWVVAAYVDQVTIAGNDALGSLAEGVVAYATYDATLTNTLVPSAPPVKVKAKQVVAAGTYRAPSWFVKAVGDFSVSSTFGYDPEKKQFSEKITLATPNLRIGAKGSPVSFVIKSMSFIFKGTVGGDITLGVEGDVEMDIPAAFGDAPPDLIFSMVNSEQSGTETVSASIELKDDAGWQNAFGLKGLTLYDLAFSFGVQVSAVPIPLPTVGVRASATLPSTVRDPIGMPDDAVITAFGNLAEETPCLGINVTVPQGSTENILNIAGGVVTASEFDLYVAPAGCQIATTQYPKGFGLSIKGSVLQTTVDISGKLDLEPFDFDVFVDVGAFQAGPLQMMETRIGVHMETNPNEKPGLGTSLDDSVSFSGGFDLFGTTVTASGELAFENGVTKGDLKIASNGFTVDGFSISDVDFEATISSSIIRTNLDIKGSGKVGVLGAYLDVEAFEFRIANNVVDKISARVETVLPGPADSKIDGTFNLAYTSSPRAFDVGASAALEIGDFSLARGQFDINDRCASLSASLNLPGVVDAAVAGYLVYQSDCSIPNIQGTGTIAVEGGAGTFCAYAAVNDLTIASFSAAGSIQLANNGDQTCSGAGGAPGDLTGALTANLILGAQGVSNAVSVNGSFGSNGVFDLNGSATVDLIGFNVALQVRAARAAGGASVSASGSVGILGSSVALSGTFTNEGGYPTTTLSGTASALNLGGYRPASTTVTLRQSAQGVGLSGNVVLNLGLIKFNSVTTFVAGGPNGVLFYTSDDIGFTVSVFGRQLVGSGISAVLTNCSDSSCGLGLGSVVLQMSGSVSILGKTFRTPTISIDTSGNFEARMFLGPITNSATVPFAGCDVGVKFTYSLTMTFEQKSFLPSVSITGTGDAGAGIRCFAWRVDTGPVSFDFRGAFSMCTPLKLDGFLAPGLRTTACYNF
jgi:hypothetical protein